MLAEYAFSGGGRLNYLRHPRPQLRPRQSPPLGAGTSSSSATPNCRCAGTAAFFTYLNPGSCPCPRKGHPPPHRRLNMTLEAACSPGMTCLRERPLSPWLVTKEDLRPEVFFCLSCIKRGKFSFWLRSRVNAQAENRSPLPAPGPADFPDGASPIRMARQREPHHGHPRGICLSTFTCRCPADIFILL